MGHFDPSPSYDELLQAFKEAINRVLSGAVLPPICGVFDVTLTLAMLDIANAVRQRRPTQALVTRACAAFSAYAADCEELRAPTGTRASSTARSRSVTV